MAHKHKWEVIKTIWPYEHGYGTWCPKCRTLLDQGLSEEEAMRDNRTRARALYNRYRETPVVGSGGEVVRI